MLASSIIGCTFIDVYRYQIEKIQAQKYALDIPVQSKLKPGMQEFPAAVLTIDEEK